MNDVIVSGLVFLSLALAGCAAATPDDEPQVDTIVEPCNHGDYFADGDIVWYAWHDYETLPTTVEVKAADGVVLEHWIRDLDYAKRVIVQCGTTDGQTNVTVGAYADIAFVSAATSQ